jgi:nitrate reductase NapA
MATAAGIAAAETLFPGVAFPGRLPVLHDKVDWRKTPCRFCGTGCGLLVGIKEGKAVAVRVILRVL